MIFLNNNLCFLIFQRRGKPKGRPENQCLNHPFIVQKKETFPGPQLGPIPQILHLPLSSFWLSQRFVYALSCRDMERALPLLSKEREGFFWEKETRGLLEREREGFLVWFARHWEKFVSKEEIRRYDLIHIEKPWD